jgi:hypothetical protein
MNTNLQIHGTDMKTRLTTLWVFVMFNYLYCDVIALMNPDLLKQFMAGKLGGMPVSQGFLLGSSILMEIPIAMIILSRLLNYQANRRANLIAGGLMTIVQIASLFFGMTLTMYYIFFSVIEIACTALIAWYAWKWSNPIVNPAQ